MTQKPSGDDEIKEEYILAFIAGRHYNNNNECERKLNEYYNKLKKIDKNLDKVHDKVKELCENEKQNKCQTLNASFKAELNNIKGEFDEGLRV
ncbi:hypothetical protein MERGE_000797 [Pneumocystis wakefieldiae]|uniref:Uncharacterized protein n=1 Tax=Pneumocystis wakefieldiae TaxID=38082 RepID=A0A899GCU3_9ASCO|nr:hypothetical protein MERGE_000797 [Pneumocystis wakefieldiae]